MGKFKMHNFEINSIIRERAYNHTAILIYIKACIDVLGDVNVRIGNSLNQGFFTYIETDGSLDERTVRRISERMQKLIDADIPINTETRPVRDAMRIWRNARLYEKARLLEFCDPSETIDLCELDGYRNCFYGEVLPSTGYVFKFELRKYRRGMLLRLPNSLSPHEVPPYRDDDKLYDEYADSKRMRRATGLDYLADLNERIRMGDADDIIRASEAHHEKELNEIADLIIEGDKRIILIAGPSSSGKTTTAKRLCNILAQKSEEPIYLGTDDYFVNRIDTPLGPDGTPDYEGLAALDLELFNSQMNALLNGETVDIPEYDFATGEKTFGKRITEAKPGQAIVIEGIHSLNDELTRDIDPKEKFKIYISPLTQIAIDRHNRISTTDARKLRRMVRDNQFRSIDAATTISNWPKVRAGENSNIFPYSSSADFVFNSSTVYETNLLKSYAQPLLESITKDMPQYDEARRMIGFLRLFEPISDATAVPENSILREFIGK